jgi:predicted RNA polymerase sigma factor
MEIAAAEDAVQDAVIAAATQWPWRAFPTARRLAAPGAVRRSGVSCSGSRDSDEDAVANQLAEAIGCRRRTSSSEWTRTTRSCCSS